VWERLRTLGWAAPLVLVPYLFVNVADTLGWRCAIPAHARGQVGFWTLYLTRMAGEALNSATPTAAVGGEPAKAVLLRQAGMGGADSVASVVIAKTALVAAQSFFTALGFVALFAWMGRHWLAGVALALLVTGSLGFTVTLVWVQRRNPTAALWRTLRRFLPRARFVARLEPRVADLDRRLADFYGGERRAFVEATAWHLVGWLIGIGETLLLTTLIGARISFHEAFIIEALSQVIRATSIVIPGGIGTQEVGGVALCTYLGMSEADAVALWLLKRAREVVMDGVGLAYLAGRSARMRTA
jgi:uncharacterized protein (TIRG00374 family)